MLNNIAAIYGTGVVAGDYDSIATLTASGVTNVTFSSIPGTYSHLQIRGIANKTTPADWASLRFNGDTAANYSYHTLQGNGTAATATGGASTTNTYTTIITPTTASTFGAFVIDILDYANTNKYKTIRSLTGYDANGSGQINLSSGNWRNSASAITSINISAPTNFNTGTTFALYGIK